MLIVNKWFPIVQNKSTVNISVEDFVGFWKISENFFRLELNGLCNALSGFLTHILYSDDLAALCLIKRRLNALLDLITYPHNMAVFGPYFCL